MPISILLGSSNQPFNHELRSVLEEENDFSVSVPACGIRELVTKAEKQAPDIVLLDLSSGELEGKTQIEQVAMRLQHSRIIAVAAIFDREHLSQILQAGISGCVLKKSVREELAKAVRAVHEKGGFLSPPLTHLLMEDYVSRIKASRSPRITALTKREREILAHLAEGQSSKEIAGELFISVKTVENHRFQLMKKLDIHNLAELTKFAIRHGLTSL